MVIKMNNKQVMKEVKDKLKLNDKSLLIFSNIVNDIPVIGKSNKEKIIKEFIEQLNVDKIVAEHYYEVFSEIIAAAIKDKIKHPFKK